MNKMWKKRQRQRRKRGKILSKLRKERWRRVMVEEE